VRNVKGPHNYEALRTIVIDILLQRESIAYGPRDYPKLVDGVAEVLVRRGAEYTDDVYTGPGLRMDSRDVELVRDIFWDLFRQGIVILGRDDMNENWPNFRLSHHAQATLAQKHKFSFHNANSYLKLVRQEAPDILQETEVYLAEAISTYYADCLLACTVMIGVAAEIEFLRLLDAGVANSAYSSLFTPAAAERQLRQKIIKFQAIIPLLPSAMLKAVGEDVATQINSIQSVLRIARNKAGHALSNRTPSREEVYILMQLFVHFVGHVERLRKQF
jgi:hypothetical protein